MTKRTPFFPMHVKANARMLNFSGWEMPLSYGSQMEEHHCVRNKVGFFDVSHMGIVDIEGEDATAFLSYLLANNIHRLTDGRAIYSCMLNEKGGVIDDLIVYRFNAHYYRAIINAGRREVDIAWMQNISNHFKQLMIKERSDLVMLAIQGPKSQAKMEVLFPVIKEKLQQLKPFYFLMSQDFLIARTGYTGEDGFEIIFPNDKAAFFWDELITNEIAPCGLAARDTLRLEAGFNLYGNDMDENISPLESNLSWTVAFDPKDREFIGRKALELKKNKGIQTKLVGLVLESKGVMRRHQSVFFNDERGEVTSGGFSPTLGQSIAFARVPIGISTMCQVQIRDKLLPAKVINPPFVRQGKKMF